MRKIFIAALFSLWSQIAAAGINCPLPFTLVNGTTADATQVMANYNALVSCLATAATAGANTDITSILGLTTPLAPAEGGTQWFVGGTSTGSSNAYTVASLTPGNFTLSPGTFVVFIASFTNTGPTTWNINSKGATNVQVHTATGLSNLSGGEIVTGQATLGFYDGTQFQLLDAAPATGFVQPCTIIDYTGVTTPSGYLAADGSTKIRASFPNLFGCLAVSGVAATTTNGNPTITVPNSALFQVGWSVGGNNVVCNTTIQSIPGGGTTLTLTNNATGNGATTLTIGPYSQGDCSTTFALPNLQGRLTTGVDTAGGTLSATACPNPATIGSRCGSTTQTIAVTNLPPITSSGNITLNPAGSSANHIPLSVNSTAWNFGTLSGGTGCVGATNCVPSVVGTNEGDTNQVSGTGTVNSTGTATTPFLLQPVGLVQKAIKF